MKIKELVYNDEFEFNPHFRIYKYIPDYSSSEEGEVILKYDSYDDGGIPEELYEEDITAINQAINGTLEIEYV